MELNNIDLFGNIISLSPLTCFITEPATSPSRPHNIKIQPARKLTTMQHHHDTNSSQKTQYIQLAIRQINSEKNIVSQRSICRGFTVPGSTVYDQLRGAVPRAEARPNGMKLTELEEDTILE